jgi:hypothetical protein
MDTSTITFVGNSPTVTWFFASFDSMFNLIDSVYCPPTNTQNIPPSLIGISSAYIESSPLTVTNACYIMGIYYDQNTYQLVNTLYISDVNALQEKPFSCLPGNGISSENNLQNVIRNNLSYGLLDLSTLPTENISFLFCGDITKYVADDNMILTLSPTGCSGKGFIFGNHASIPNICVSPDVVAGVASNWVLDYSSPYETSYPYSAVIPPPQRGNNIKNKISTTLANNKQPTTSNNMLIYIIVIIIIIAVIISIFILIMYKHN